MGPVDLPPKEQPEATDKKIAAQSRSGAPRSRNSNEIMWVPYPKNLLDATEAAPGCRVGSGSTRADAQKASPAEGVADGHVRPGVAATCPMTFFATRRRPASFPPKSL